MVFVKQHARLIKPMKLQSASGVHLEDSSYWAERKWDGTRVEVIKEAGNVQIISSRSIEGNNANGYTSLFPEIVRELRKISSDVILDGELVWVRKNDYNRDAFLTITAKPETIREKDVMPKLKVFDIMWKDGEYLMQLPIEERRRILESVITPALDERLAEVDVTRLVSNNKPAFFREVVAAGGEGIVLKLRGSPYQEGERSYFWRKNKKTETGDYIAIGYKKGTGAREATIGSIILARWDGNKFVYAGHTSGFKDYELAEWKNYFDSQSAFGGWQDAFKAKAEKIIDPTRARVIEVEMLNKTDNGVARMPSFLRIRTDKSVFEAEG